MRVLHAGSLPNILDVPHYIPCVLGLVVPGLANHCFALHVADTHARLTLFISDTLFLAFCPRLICINVVVGATRCFGIDGELQGM